MEYKYIVTKGIVGVVGRRCVPFGGRWGCENRGCRYQATACVCLVAGVVALCVVEGVGLLATAVGWRMSSWFGDTSVLFVLAGLLDYC